MKPDQTLQAIFPSTIDSTMRNDYVSCGRSFELARLYGLSHQGGSIHLVAGGAFARGCEVTRSKFYFEGYDEMDAIVEGVLAAWEYYGDFEVDERFAKKSPERVAYALVEYFSEYPLPLDKLKPYTKADGTPAIEFEFTFPLEVKHPTTGDPLLYGGRFDMVGVYMSDLWVVDEKTASQLGQQWLRSFTLRGQLIGYCYAARQFGLPVNGFVVRGISFLKDYYGHAEIFEVVPDHRIQQWREQLEDDAEAMVRDWKRGRYGWAFGDACNAYGGCPFRDTLCDKQDWKLWWQQSFEVNRWNPLQPREVKVDAPVLNFASAGVQK